MKIIQEKIFLQSTKDDREKTKTKLKINKIYLGVDKKNLHAIKAFKKTDLQKKICSSKK